MSTADYQAIAEKIAASPQGAPMRDGEISPAFIDFLKVVYTPEQAKYVRLLEMDRQFLPQVADLSNYKTPSQLAEVTGDASSGYVATILVTVA